MADLVRRKGSVGAPRPAGAYLSLASSVVLVLLSKQAEAQALPARADPLAPNTTDADAAAKATPAFVLTPNASIDGTFTDNSQLLAKGGQSDWITTLTGGLDFTGKTEKTQLAGTYSVSGDFYARDSSLNGYRQNLLTIDRVEPVKGVFSIDLRASVDQEQIALTGAQPATIRSGLTNQTQVANASITPSYTKKWGNWAVSTLSYSLNEVDYFDGGNNSTSNDLNSSTQQTLTANLASGSRFTQLTWNLGFTEDVSRGTETHLDQQTAEADAEYRINSVFRVPVTVGYDNFSENQSGFASNSLSGVFWNTGIHLVPGPRTELVLRYGRRYDKPYESGSFTYKILPNVQLNAKYDITVQTQQQTLADSLQGLTVNSNGSIVSPISGLTGTPNTTGTDLVNGVYRARTFQFGVSGNHGLNFFSLTGQDIDRSYGGTEGDDRSEGATLVVGRNITPRTTASLNVEAQHTVSTATVLDVGSSFSLLTSATVAYKLGEKTDVSFDFSRRHQTGVGAADEDAFVVRLSHTF